MCGLSLTNSIRDNREHEMLQKAILVDQKASGLIKKDFTLTVKNYSLKTATAGHHPGKGAARGESQRSWGDSCHCPGINNMPAACPNLADSHWHPDGCNQKLQQQNWPRAPAQLGVCGVSLGPGGSAEVFPCPLPFPASLPCPPSPCPGSHGEVGRVGAGR